MWYCLCIKMNIKPFQCILFQNARMNAPSVHDHVVWPDFVIFFCMQMSGSCMWCDVRRMLCLIGATDVFILPFNQSTLTFWRLLLVFAGDAHRNKTIRDQWKNIVCWWMQCIWHMQGVDVERIRPRKVQVYLLGPEMGGNANFETTKTTLAC